MQSRKTLNLLSIAAAPLLLAACGGGSGGPGGPGGGGGTTFLGFSQIQPNTPTTINGIGNVATVDVDGGTLAVTEPQDATIVVEYDDQPELKSANLTVGSVNSVWNSTNSEENEDPDVPENLYVAERTDDSGGLIAFARPEVPGFEYQTYGAWVDEDGAGTTHGGAFSFGREAPDQLVAASTQNAATFKGTAAGIYVDGTVDGDGDLNRFAYTANASVTVDSGDDMLLFATTDSETRPMTDVGGVATANADLDMHGNLTYDLASNTFRGSVENDNDMSGTAAGRLYGPDGEEAGGIFGLQDSANVKTLIGGFGTKKITP